MYMLWKSIFKMNNNNINNLFCWYHTNKRQYVDILKNIFA